MRRRPQSSAASRDEIDDSASAEAAATAAAAAELPLRPDVFLSYSRSEERFVRRLAAALEARGKDVWVDLSDIRKGADWHEKMLAGVESARVVVPVISPAFTRSEACAQEIEHAVAHNKRLVPIVERSVDRGLLRSELTAPNWIFFEDDERFEAGVDELVEAADADFDWLDEHARLLSRALEWDRAEERVKPSLLLRGRDLRAAEDWLAEQSGHRERATPAQVDYIVASRRSASRRQQITIGAVAVALAVAIALTIFALIQRSDAIHASNLAGSRELAVESTAASARIRSSRCCSPFGPRAERTHPRQPLRCASPSTRRACASGSATEAPSRVPSSAPTDRPSSRRARTGRCARGAPVTAAPS
jgi:hypothetical protein